MTQEDDDTLGWLALMRHYGTPCRLLDFTFSLFIATYFAVEAENAKPVIWAVNKSWLTQHMESVVSSNVSDYKRFLEAWDNREGWAVNTFMKFPFNVVTGTNPKKMNPRLEVQQGLFLCASNVSIPFQEAVELIPEAPDNLVEIRIDADAARCEILTKLFRMNINGATLFHGLQGYAESLRPRIPSFLKVLALRAKGARMGSGTVTGL
jgi:hypothetical protein